MNSQFPESPEDRLLDELLREQSHAPDDAFLQKIDSAIDASSAKPKRRHLYRNLGLAAAVTLAAGGFLWSSLDRSERKIAANSNEKFLASSPPAAPPREEIVVGGIRKQDRRPPGPTLNRVQALAAESNYALPEIGPEAEMPPLASSTVSGGGMSGGLGGAGTGRGSGRGSGVGRGLGFGGGSDAAGMAARESPMPASAAEIALARDKAESDGNLRGMLSEIGPEPSSGDQYGQFTEQPWKSPTSDPLSTFSIDVDTASYSNIRRMIREGRQIPRDAVRIEECINAFDYNYTPPEGDNPFAVTAEIAACPWADGHQLVRIAIKGREIAINQRPASNLVFLIDVSGSMNSPDKLPLLKQSMATLVDQLDERDRVAIVVYAGSEGVALESTRLDEAGRAQVQKALAKLESGGSTNGGAGIERAYDLAMAQKIDGGVNRVILATDGDFNVGVTGQSALVEMVKSRAKGGVYLTVLGFGSGNLNDAMMDAITRDGNGNYFYIDSEREGRKVFLQKLSGTLVTIAKDVKIQVEFNPARVGQYRLIGYANRILKNEDFANDKVDAGDIGAGHTVTAFYEIAPPGTASDDGLKYQPAAPTAPSVAKNPSNEWLTVKLRYKHPDGDVSRKIELPLAGDAIPLASTDADFRFATAAALFGMKLRGMDEATGITWQQVIDLARPGLANDPREDRAEFVGLLRRLESLQ